MSLLTPEQREYKKNTLQHLQASLPLLEAKLAEETRPEVVRSLRGQIEDIEAHIVHLQAELAENMAGEPVADEFCRKIARALVKEKFFLAKKYLNRLETIEPFYPGLDRLREEVKARRAGRRTRAIAQGSALPYGAATFADGATMAVSDTADSLLSAAAEEEAAEPGRLAWFLQFHVVLSCLVVLLILCTILGIGGVTVLQWLIEG